MSPARTLISIAPIAVALVLGGCRRGSSPEADALFGAERAPVTAIDPAWAYPASPAEAAFSVIGDTEEETGAVQLEIIAGESSDQWRVLYRNAGEATPFREDLLARIESNVVMLESLNRDRGALTLYDPPLVLMPPTLTPGAPYARESRMTVHPPDDRAKVTRRGVASQRIEWVGVQPVNVGGVWVECVRVRSEFSAQLAPATVENVTERWYSESSPVGLVAERYDEKLFVFGALSSTRGHLWMLKATE